MTDKERFDSISILYIQAWDNFNERRRYEIKISYSVYTVYALAIAGLFMTVKEKYLNDTFIWGTGIVGGVLILIHLMWLISITRANYIDRKIAIHYEEFLQTIANCCFSNDFHKTYLKDTTLSKNNTKTV